MFNNPVAMCVTTNRWNQNVEPARTRHGNRSVAGTLACSVGSLRLGFGTDTWTLDAYDEIVGERSLSGNLRDGGITVHRDPGATGPRPFTNGEQLLTVKGTVTGDLSYADPISRQGSEWAALTAWRQHSLSRRDEQVKVSVLRDGIVRLLVVGGERIEVMFTLGDPALFVSHDIIHGGKVNTLVDESA